MPQRTIDEAAQILGVTAAEVWRRIRRGDLAGHREGSAREVRLVVEVPELMAAASAAPAPAAPARPATSDLARELRGDLALLVREMDAYREEAEILAREREDLRQILEGALTDLHAVRVPLPPPPAEEVPQAPTPEVPAPEPEAEPTPEPEPPAQTQAEAPHPVVATDTPPATEESPATAAFPDAAAAEPEPEPPAPEPPTPDPALPDAGRRRPLSRYVAAGVRLHYLEWTPSQPVAAPPVILIHGISGNARNYDALTAALGDRFHLYALDLRGHGDSAWDENRDYRISALVYDLNAFIDALGLSEVVLIGTGLGADVALGMVSARPGVVRGLVLNDSGPEAGSSGLRRVLQAIQEAPEQFDGINAAMTWWREHYPALTEYDDAVVADFIQSTLRRTPDGRLVWKFDPALREIDDLGTLRDVDLSVAVGRIACPTLVVRGEYSDVLGRDAARRLGGRVHAASVVEAKGVAHAPSLVEDDVLPALESFLLSIGQEGPVAAS